MKRPEAGLYHASALLRTVVGTAKPLVLVVRAMILFCCP